MLIRFNVKNFLSFASRSDDERSEEFSMLSGNNITNVDKQNHVKNTAQFGLLKFAAIYGANAAGKSNLVKAMDFMRSTVVDSLPKGHTEKYCKSDISNRDKASYFELEIMVKDKYYAYGFEIILSQSKFLSEWLVEIIDENNERTIFSRDIEKNAYEFDSDLQIEGLWEKLQVYADDIRGDGTVLLLSMMNKNKKLLYRQYPEIEIMQKIYEWLGQKFDINYPNKPISDYTYMRRTENVEKICTLIKAFGTGITGFSLVPIRYDAVMEKLPRTLVDDVMQHFEAKVSQMRMENKNIPITTVVRGPKDLFIITYNDEDISCQTIKFSHGRSGAIFDISEESDGTVRLLDLLEILLSDDGKTYVIDELDRCLHPILTYKFVETYLNLAKNRNQQLIVTTHESRLLDFDLLRRDEIWFVNKRYTGESDIYSLDEYNTKFDRKIDKAYLDGRYGGVPIFSTVFPIDDEV